MKTFSLTLACVGCLVLLAVPKNLPAADDVSKVVAVRGSAFIERDRKEMPARVNTGVLLKDEVGTGEASRVKLLFLDDSVLTLGEKSRLSVQEYVMKKDERGRSLFNLLDGKMRSVVGKSQFEVHTPTAVAAARGTVILFHAGSKEGKRFTVIQCVEGIVLVSSASPRIQGSVTLAEGMSITVWEDEPLSSPVPADLQPLLDDTNITPDQIRLQDPGPREMGPALVGWPGMGDITGAETPPVPQQPMVPTVAPPSGGTTVNIIFP